MVAFKTKHNIQRLCLRVTILSHRKELDIIHSSINWQTEELAKYKEQTSTEVAKLTSIENKKDELEETVLNLAKVESDHNASNKNLGNVSPALPKAILY